MTVTASTETDRMRGIFAARGPIPLPRVLIAAGQRTVHNLIRADVRLGGDYRTSVGFRESAMQVPAVVAHLMLLLTERSETGEPTTEDEQLAVELASRLLWDAHRSAASMRALMDTLVVPGLPVVDL